MGGDSLHYLPGMFPSKAHSLAQAELMGTLRMGLTGMEVGDTKGGVPVPGGPYHGHSSGTPREGGVGSLPSPSP